MRFEAKVLEAKGSRLKAEKKEDRIKKSEVGMRKYTRFGLRGSER